MKDRIIELLRENARLSDEDIARMLDTDTKKVSKIIHELEENKTILKYCAVVNEEALEDDQSVTAFIEVKVTPERDKGFDSIAERLQQFPEVQSVYLMSGAYDLIIVVQGKSLKEVARFVTEKLSPLGRILSTGTHFLLKKYKENGVVMGFKDNQSTRLNVVL